MLRSRLLLVAGLLAISACGTTSTPKPSPLSFEQCGDIQCATLSVPLDRSGGSKELGLKVYLRQGSHSHTPVLLHPGGPGADVKSVVEDVVNMFGNQAEDFDFYGLSTRGSADGMGAQCVGDLHLIVKSEVSERAALKVANGCKELSSDLVGNVGTRDSVEDIEQLREALGLKQLSFIGWSYGATLGAVWAMAHPASVRSLVLDAPEDPTIGWSEQFGSSLRVQQRNVDVAIHDCEINSSCVLHEKTKQRLQDLSISKNSTSLALATELQLYDNDFAPLFSAVMAAEKGNSADLDSIANARLGISSDGADDGGLETQLLVRCSDVSHSQAVKAINIARTFSPTIMKVGMGAAFERVCLRLPEPKRPTGSIIPNKDSQGLPVLVVASTNDPVLTSSYSLSLASRMKWGSREVSSSQHLAVSFDQATTTAALNCIATLRCK